MDCGRQLWWGNSNEWQHEFIQGINGHINFFASMYLAKRPVHKTDICIDKSWEIVLEHLNTSTTLGIFDSAQFWEIPSEMFKNFPDLEFVRIPAHIKTIGKYWFTGCMSLRRVGFEKDAHLYSIEDGAFMDCKSLQELELPASVKILRQGCFSKCINLERVSCSKDSRLKTIEANGFASCSALRDFQLPNGLKVIGESAFTAAGLRRVDVGSVKTLGDRCFANSSIEELRFEGELEAIPDYAFNHCDRLESVVFSSNIIVIRIKGFGECKKLSYVEFPEDSKLKRVERSAFEGCPIMCCDFPAATEVIEENCFRGNTVLNRLSFPGARVIGKGICRNCISLDQITIPAGVKEIPEGAFDGCRSLRQVTFMQNSRSKVIENDAFGKDENVQFEKKEGVWRCGDVDLSFPEDWDMQIHGATLERCSGVVRQESSDVFDSRMINKDSDTMLMKMHITDVSDHAFCKLNTKYVKFESASKCTRLGRSAFRGCDLSEGIELQQGLMKIEDECFKQSRLRSIEIPKSVESLGNETFSHCHDLRSVTFQDGIKLKLIPAYCFYGCKNLTTTLGNTAVEEIDEIAFALSGIQNVRMPDSLVYIRMGAFAYCPNLQKVTCGAKLDDIGNRVFLGCSRLSIADFTLCKNLVYIGAYAFSETRLREIILPSCLNTIECGCFSGCVHLRVVKFEDSDKQILICHGCFSHLILKLVDFGNREVMTGYSGQFGGDSCKNYSPFFCSKIREVRMKSCVKESLLVVLNGTSLIDRIVIKLRPPHVWTHMEQLGYEFRGGVFSRKPRAKTTLGKLDYSGRDLKCFCDFGLAYQHKITSLVISESVERLGAGCFHGCAHLFKVKYDKDNYVLISRGKVVQHSKGPKGERLRQLVEEALADSEYVREVIAFRDFWNKKPIKEEDWDHIEDDLPPYLADWKKKVELRSEGFPKVLEILKDRDAMNFTIN